MEIIIAKFGAWIIAALAVICGVWAGRSSAKSVGKAKEKTKQAEEKVAESEKRIENVKAANNVKENVSNSSAESVANKLRDEWTRD